MDAHLSREELAAYRSGSASAAELLRMDDHLTACAECRAGLAFSFPATAGAAFLDLDLSPEHLTEDQLDAWAAGRPMAAEAMEHLEHCAECRGHAEDLRKFVSAHPPRATARPAKILWMAAAAAVLAALAIGLWNRNAVPPAP